MKSPPKQFLTRGVLLGTGLICERSRDGFKITTWYWWNSLFESSYLPQATVRQISILDLDSIMGNAKTVHPRVLQNTPQSLPTTPKRHHKSFQNNKKCVLEPNRWKTPPRTLQDTHFWEVWDAFLHVSWLLWSCFVCKFFGWLLELTFLFGQIHLWKLYCQANFFDRSI